MITTKITKPEGNKLGPRCNVFSILFSHKIAFIYTDCSQEKVIFK